jgi:phage terminase small subunit
MARGLTRKQKGFVKAIIQGKNGTEAALEVYETDKRNVAEVIASENLSKPIIIDAIEDALPDELLAKVHKEGLSASKQVFKNNNETGEIENVGEEPDFSVRHKYLDSAYKIKGKYAAEKSINVNVNAEEMREIIQHGIAKFRS